MKNVITKISLMAALCAVGLSSVSCGDSKKNPTPKPPFSSELIGTYEPTFVTKKNPSGEDQQYYLTFEATWTDPDNIPTVDLMGMPMPMNTILEMVEAMGSAIVKDGLVEVALKNDGTFGAKYKNLIIEGSDMSSILGALLDPKFEETVNQFPAEGLPLPGDAVRYYTKEGKFYFTVSRAFLKQVGGSGMDIETVIDGLLAQYPNLGIVSRESHYAIPLKYTKKDGVVKLYVDRDMMVPFFDALSQLLGALGPDATGGVDVSKLLKDLKTNTTALELAFRLKSK